MATLRLTNINKIKTEFRKDIIKALRSEEVRKTIASEIVESIRDTSFRSLSTNESYYKFRDKILNSKHPKFKNKNINLTITGELLDDLIKNIKLYRTSNSTSYIIKHSNKKHKPYIVENYKTNGTKKIASESSKKRTKPVAYETIRKGLYELGYEYLADIDDKVLERSIKKVRQLLINILSR